MNHVSAVFHSCRALSKRWNLQLNEQGTAKFRRLPWTKLCSRVPAMVGWLPPGLSSCNASDRTLTFWPTFCGSTWLHRTCTNQKICKTSSFEEKNCRTCAHKWGVLELAIKRAAFPDHGACGRASIALRRARKVCTLCAARVLSRFLFFVEPSYRNNSRFKRPVRVNSTLVWEVWCPRGNLE